MENPWIDYKDYVPILVGFFLGTIVSGQDYASPSCHNDVLTSSYSLGVVDVVDVMRIHIIIQYTLLTYHTHIHT
jgi:hypothetical protein